MVWRERNLNTMTGRPDIDHIPALPGWLGIVRVVQLVLAIIIVGVVGYAANQFTGIWDGYAMTFFTFAWTILYFGYLLISTLVAPAIYHIWAHLALEALTTLFWLVSWALLASEASAFNTAFYGYGYSYSSYYPSNWKRAIDCTKAGAGLGALEWLLFIVTLVFGGLAFHRSRVSAAPTVTTNTTAAPAVAMEEHRMQPMV